MTKIILKRKSVETSNRHLLACEYFLIDTINVLHFSNEKKDNQLVIQYIEDHNHIGEN